MSKGRVGKNAALIDRLDREEDFYNLYDSAEIDSFFEKPNYIRCYRNPIPFWAAGKYYYLTMTA
jgi:hypothetical protein